MIHSDDCSIKELFCRYSYVFHVPNYQRYYVWCKDEIQSFLDDASYTYRQIEGNYEYQHFFGQIILRKKMDIRGNRQCMEIVDGQQRLSTISILFASIYRKIERIKLSCDEATQTRANRILSSIKRDFLTSSAQFADDIPMLTLSPNDNQIINAITQFNDIELEEIKQSPDKESVKNLCNAYDYITNNIETLFPVDAQPATIIELFARYVEIVSTRFRIVLLTTDIVGYDYTLYQIVNDRGISLTPAELLKARTMQLLSNNPELSLSCERLWDDILSDPGKLTQHYLVWHYVSVKFENISARNNLNENYEKNIFLTNKKHQLTIEEQNTLHQQLLDLYHSVTICRSLTNGAFPATGCSEVLLCLYRVLVVNLKNESCIPIFINILKMDREAIIRRAFEEVTFMLSKFFFVGKTISNIHAGSITKCYNDISRIIREGTYSMQSCRDILNRKLAEKRCIQNFESKLGGDIYSDSSTISTKYILFILELFSNTTDYSLNHLRRRTDDSIQIIFDRLTTEHIYGQNMNAENRDAQLESRKNMLGNLTPLGEIINGDQGNKTYSAKRPAYLASRYALTRDVAGNTTWGIAEFNLRQVALKQKVIDIFTL